MAINTNFQTFTLQMQLDAVRKAMMDCLVAAQSYDQAGRGLVRVRFDLLVEREAQLMAMIAAETTSGYGGEALGQFGDPV